MGGHSCWLYPQAACSSGGSQSYPELAAICFSVDVLLPFLGDSVFLGCSKIPLVYRLNPRVE